MRNQKPGGLPVRAMLGKVLSAAGARHLTQLPVMGGLTMLLPHRAAIDPLPDDGYRPLVFVHGHNGGPGNFLPMRAYLKLHGRRRSYALAFPDHGNLSELALQLAGTLREVAVANGLGDGASIDIVAHSMGGLVTRLALEDPTVAARVATLVTLGTPHGGTDAAHFTRVPRLVELRPGSSMLERLRQQLPWPARPDWPRLVNLYSPHDMYLLPSSTAHVEGAENVRLPGLTHFEYLLSPTGWRGVLEALRGP